VTWKIEGIGWNGEKLLKEGLENKTLEIIELPEGKKPLEEYNLYDFEVIGGMKN
jgi:hypothetical protein